MVLYQEVGTCTSGYYAGADGLTDLQSCFDQCLAELECLYVSFLAGKSCARFKSPNCDISLSHSTSDKRSVTYQKVEKGMSTNTSNMYLYIKSWYEL